MDDKLKELLSAMPEKDASDLHITANNVLHYRINSDLVAIGQDIVSPERSRELAYSLMDEGQIKRFEDKKEMDFAFAIENVARYRANVFLQRGHVGCAIRMIPVEIKTIEECGLPVKVIEDFCALPKGLVLVTGATGSGKSTTLAAMVDRINRTRKCHIVTIEDPVEFVHQNNQAIIDQREVFFDTFSFHDALRHVLRQDPDVILIGELRDYESIMSALIIADTGHLVLGTLHTSDSIQTINRIIDVFPAHQQKQVRAQLSFVLLGIVAQQLLVTADNSGRVLAGEVLVVTPPVRNMIRDERVHHIYSTIQTSQKLGMKTMNQALMELYLEGKVSYEEVMTHSVDPEELGKLIGAKE